MQQKNHVLTVFIFTSYLEHASHIARIQDYSIILLIPYYQMASKQEWIFQTSETSSIRVEWNIFIFINLVEIFLVFICSPVLINIVATVIFDDSETLFGISVFILCCLESYMKAFQDSFMWCCF